MAVETRSKTKNRLIVVLISALFLIAIATLVISRIPPNDAQVYENEGQVCFIPTAGDMMILHVYSGGCFPTYCTKVYERTGSIDVNNDMFIIQVESHFVVLDITKRKRGCAADCGGAGWLELKTSKLIPGEYTVKHGNEIIGQLQVPLPTEYGVCLESLP